MILLFTFQVSYALSIEEKSTNHVFDQLLKIENTTLSEDIIESYKTDFLKTISSYQSKQVKRGQNTKALKHLFYKTHRQYLKSYVPYQSFAKLLTDGTYGCLTATALYALLLEELGYEYEIIETNYHIFLVGEVSGQRFLIESTDPINGFLDSDKEIDERLNEVTAKGATPSTEDRYRFSFNINRSISLEEMVGLQYYNMASQAYNNGNYIQAVADLDRAHQYYQSERINEFLLLVIDRIALDRNLLIELNLNKQRFQILATL
jgi:hypothetical protein